MYQFEDFWCWIKAKFIKKFFAKKVFFREKETILFSCSVFRKTFVGFSRKITQKSIFCCFEGISMESIHRGDWINFHNFRKIFSLANLHTTEAGKQEGESLLQFQRHSSTDNVAANQSKVTRWELTELCQSLHQQIIEEETDSYNLPNLFPA